MRVIVARPRIDGLFPSYCNLWRQRRIRRTIGCHPTDFQFERGGRAHSVRHRAPPYNDTDQVLSLLVSGVPLGTLSTGIMTVNASSDVDGGAGDRFAMADAEVNDLSLELVPGTGSPDLLNLTADQVVSNSIVSGDFGSLVGVGDTVLTNTVLTILGVDVAITSNPAPNTVVFNNLGITVTLNEQFVSGDGISSRGQATNAIHIGLVDVIGGGGLVNGDIIISHSAANLRAVVPEPSSMVAAVVGLGWLAVRRRRR
ncbi:MAG: choice-of-anchor P family protein [Fimbriimonadales bacterium]